MPRSEDSQDPGLGSGALIYLQIFPEGLCFTPFQDAGTESRSHGENIQLKGGGQAD